MRIQQDYSMISAKELEEKVRSPDIDNIVDYTDNGKCRDCGNCCGNFLPITEEEARKIRRYVKKHNLHPAKSYFVNGPFAKPTVHCDCPFLLEQDEHRCMIYKIRPGICRAYTCHNPMHNPELIKVGLRYTKTINMYLEFFPREVFREAKEKGALDENYKRTR